MLARWLCIVVGVHAGTCVRFSETSRETAEDDGERWTVKASGRITYPAAVGDTLSEADAQWRVESVSEVSTRRSKDVVLVRRWHVDTAVERERSLEPARTGYAYSDGYSEGYS